MKKIHIIFLVVALSFTSCLDGIGDPGGEPDYDGLTFSIINTSDEAYQESTIFIGGLDQQDIYQPTDSIVLDNIKRGGGFIPYYFNENRWKPDLAKIRALPSDSCYFKIKLSNGREEFFKRPMNNNITRLALKLPEEEVFESDYGSINVQIENEIIYTSVKD